MENSLQTQVQERVLNLLKNKFGQHLPAPVYEDVMNKFERFPDVDLIEDTPENFKLENVTLCSHERNRVFWQNPVEYVNDLVKRYAPGTPQAAALPSRLETRVWAMTEMEFLEALNNQSLSLKDRQAIAAAREKQPNPEKDYIERMAAASSLEEKERIYREHNKIKDPKEVEAERQKHLAFLKDESVDTLDKLDAIAAGGKE